MTDYALWGVKNTKPPFGFRIYFSGISENDAKKLFGNYGNMSFKVLDRELNKFQYFGLHGVGSVDNWHKPTELPAWLPSDLSLLRILEYIEEKSIPEIREYFSNFRIEGIWVQGNFSIEFYDSGRISKLTFYTDIFGANGLTDEEFLQSFMNAYDIPRMDFKGNNKWEYRNPSQGWQISYSGGGGWLFSNSIELIPIITNTSFD